MIEITTRDLFDVSVLVALVINAIRIKRLEKHFYTDDEEEK